MKFCKDCEHFSAGTGKCRRPLWFSTEPVWGLKSKRLSTSAKRERGSSKTIFGREKCGLDAAFFEPSRWQQEARDRAAAQAALMDMYRQRNPEIFEAKD